MSFHDRKVQRVVEVDLVHRPEGESFDSLIPSTAELLEMGQADQQVLEKGNGFLEALDDVGSLGLGKFLASAGLTILNSKRLVSSDRTMTDVDASSPSLIRRTMLAALDPCCLSWSR